MEKVLQYEIPVWHPIAVHFPIALIFTGAVCVLLWLLRSSTFWRKCALVLYAFGMAGALFAYFTGEAMEEQVEGAPIVEELVHLHEEMGLYTLIVTGFVLVVLLTLTVWARYRPIAKPQSDLVLIRLGMGLLAILSAALVLWTAHIGGVMVWGVGT